MIGRAITTGVVVPGAIELVVGVTTGMVGLVVGFGVVLGIIGVVDTMVWYIE